MLFDLKTTKLVISVIIVLALLRFIQCRFTGKKTLNPVSSCSDNPWWKFYGFKLSTGLVLDLIIIMLCLHIIYTK